MKRAVIFFTVACTAFFFTSCDKVKSALFKPFESPLRFELTIPPIDNTATEVSMGQANVRYDLDSVIRKNTEDAFGSDIVGNMYINEIGIQLLDDNASNNLSNFDYVNLSVSSGGTPAVLGPYQIPTGSSSSVSFSVADSPNIKPYFSGSTITFSITGKANTVTTQPLRARISATIKFKK